MENFLSLLADSGDTLKPVKNLKILPLRTACGNVLLHEAISHGKVDYVRNLLKLGISHSVRLFGKSPIYHAVECDYGDIVELLAEEGADINEESSRGISLLHFAVKKGCYDAADALLALGLDVDAVDTEGLTPLYRAAENDDFDIAALLLDNGANIYTRTGETVVHLAVSRSSITAIRCFADLQIDLDEADSNLCTPIQKAAELGKLQILKALQECGAQIVTRDHDGYSLLHTAAREGNILVMKTLLDAGVDVNIMGGWWDYTPLHVAAENGNITTVKLLIQRNADVDAKTSDGRTALDLAECNKNAMICSLLRAHTSK